MHCTRHRVFLATLIVAAKYLNDSSPKNKHWTKYAALFSLAEVSLMEKQLLYLLDYDLRMTEDELCFHFQPFMKRRVPAHMGSFSSLARPTLSHRIPSLESCGSSPAASPYPVTPKRPSRSQAEYAKGSIPSMPTPSPSPRRSSHNQSSPYARRQAQRRVSPSSSDDEMEYQSEEAADSRRRPARSAGQPNRKPAAAQYPATAAPSAHLPLNLPFTMSELQSGRPTLRSKSSSSNLINSVKGYLKTLQGGREPYEEAPHQIVVDNGIIIQS